MKRTTKIVLMVFGIVVLLMAAIYLGIGVYFSERFFPGSVVNGFDVSGKNVEEVEIMIANDVQDYTLTVVEKDDKTETLHGADMLFEYVSDGAAQDLKNTQNSFLWLKAYFQPQEYTMSTPTTYDKERLKEAMKALEAFDETKIVEPQDAYIEESDEGYKMVPEVEGNRLKEDQVFELLCQAVDSGASEVNLVENDCYKKPGKTTKNKKLNKKLTVLQKYWDLKVTYVIGDKEEVLEYSVFRDWMTLSAKNEASFSWNHIADWIAALADKYDTFGEKQTFETSLGEIVKVKSKTYGWKLDEETEAAWLLETLQTGNSETREPVWLESALARGENNDIGDTYIEIDITNQRMWFYKDGELMVDTPVVTGDSTKKYDTPVGIYCIYNKEEMAILRGADNLTGDDYNTPVDFWIPFNGGVGIHDAKWRGTFGGSQYKGNGSHGCVNTPWDKAKIIFEHTSVGTPVVVYKASVNQGSPAVAISQPVETRIIDENGEEITKEEQERREAEKKKKKQQGDDAQINDEQSSTDDVTTIE